MVTISELGYKAHAEIWPSQKSYVTANTTFVDSLLRRNDFWYRQFVEKSYLATSSTPT